MSESISAAPFVYALAPYVAPIAQLAIVALVGWGVSEVKKYTGFAMSDATVAGLKSAAATEAGALIAASETNLAGQSITVNSPMVVAAAARIAASVPGGLEAFGLTPDHVAHIVAGEIGKLQPPAPVVAKA